MTSFFLRFFEGKFPFSSGKSGKLERVKLDLLENRSKSYTFLRNDDRITLRSFLIKIHRPLSSVSSPFLDIQDQFQTDGTLDSFTNNQLTRGYSTVVVLLEGVHRGQMEIFRKFPNYFRSNPFDSISGLLPLLFNSPITFFRSFSKIYPYFIRLWVITPFIRSSMIGSLSFVAEIFLIDVFFNSFRRIDRLLELSFADNRLPRYFHLSAERVSELREPWTNGTNKRDGCSDSRG